MGEMEGKRSGEKEEAERGRGRGKEAREPEGVKREKRKGRGQVGGGFWGLAQQPLEPAGRHC